MGLQYIDHYTIRVKPADLERVLRFYERALGLRDGARPPFDFPGNWLYAGDKPVVHLAGSQDEPALDAAQPDSGKFDHVSFRASGLEGMRRHLKDLGLEFREAAVPNTSLHQIFVRDPAGILVELTFDTSTG